MYEVSEEYIQQIRKTEQHFRLKGKIYTSTSSTKFTELNIVEGSASILNQCSGTEERNIGGVYTAEFRSTFINIDIEDWNGYSITLDEGLYIDSLSSYEYVPLGVFHVSESNITSDGIEIIAYDSMTKFDKPFKNTVLVGKPYDLIKYCCTQCGVSLGMSKEDMHQFINSSLVLSLYNENDIETYRDILYWIAITCAGFFVINRNGELELKKYGNEVVATIDKYTRYEGATISNFATYYIGVYLNNIKKQSVTYYGLDDKDRGLVYDLGSNPFMQYGSSDYIKEMCINILDEIKLDSVPFTATVTCAALYDLGDRIELGNGINPYAVHTNIMSYEWTYNSGCKLEAFGKNPALANAKSKTDKALSAMSSSRDSQSIYYYMFTNAAKIEVGNGKEGIICDIKFSAKDSGYAVFLAQVLLEAESQVDSNVYTDITAIVKYIWNETELTFKPTETWVDGNHILNLQYTIQIEEGSLNRWQARLNVSGGNITIPAAAVRATIFGQRLVATEAWDGYLNFEDTVSEMALQTLSVSEFNVSIETVTATSGNKLLEQHIDEITLGSISIDNI